MKKQRSEYIRWLRAAYLYYVDNTGSDTGMHDLAWDAMSRDFFAHRAEYPEAEYPVLHNPNFTGGSLFWLRKEDYPPEVVVEGEGP